MSAERERYPDGALGFLDRDPGSDRWLWSVRWPAHTEPGRCRYPDEVPHPQWYRTGIAPSRAEAMAAADASHALGEPAPGDRVRLR